MKNLRKLTPVPYGSTLKHVNNPGRLLNKLSLKQKTKFKQKNRLFSLELGRSLPKRVIWQVAVPGSSELNAARNATRAARFAPPKPHEVSLGSAKVTTQSFGPQLQSFASFGKKNPSSSGKTCFFQKKSFHTFSWGIFRSAFFGKMWLLNNASAVPGVVWPTKSKKFLVAKMKAFKALKVSTGGLKSTFLVENLQKIYARSFSACNQSAAWQMASSLDSLKASYFLKTGFFLTSPSAVHTLRSEKILLNGFVHKKTNSFMYPGDFSFFPDTSDFFAQVFSVGALGAREALRAKRSQFSEKSMYAVKPFLWLCKAFYKPLHGSQKKKKMSYHKRKF